MDAATSGRPHAGRPSRWNANKDMSWEPLRIERVGEVAYEGLMDGRFRHNARFRRWRPDKDPGRAPTRSSRRPSPTSSPRSSAFSRPRPFPGGFNGPTPVILAGFGRD